MGDLRSKIAFFSQGIGSRVKPRKLEMRRGEKKAERPEALTRSRVEDEARAAKLNHISQLGTGEAIEQGFVI